MGEAYQFYTDALTLIENEDLSKEMGLKSYALLSNTFYVDKAYQVIENSYLATKSLP